MPDSTPRAPPPPDASALLARLNDHSQISTDFELFIDLPPVNAAAAPDPSVPSPSEPLSTLARSLADPANAQAQEAYLAAATAPATLGQPAAGVIKPVPASLLTPPPEPVNAPASTTGQEITDPQRLREMLVIDLYNSQLRDRYLAARTPDMKNSDREMGRMGFIVKQFLNFAAVALIIIAVS